MNRGREMNMVVVPLLVLVAFVITLALVFRRNRSEGFGANVGIVRLRAEMRRIGDVHAVKMPGDSKGPEAGLTPVEKSPVWIDMFASATGDILREHAENSLAEVVWNEDHRMAGYVLELDARSLGLPGSLKSASVLRTPFAELEERALGRPVRVAAGGAPVFAITETFSAQNACALYDLLYVATLVKLAHEHKHAISAIFAAASDLEALRTESAKKLKTIEERGSRQRDEAETAARSTWTSFASNWQREAVSAFEAVAAKAAWLGKAQRDEEGAIALRDAESIRESKGRQGLLQAEAAIEAESARLRALSEEGTATKSELARVEEDRARMAAEVERAEAELARVHDLRRSVDKAEEEVRALEAERAGRPRAREAAEAALDMVRAALETERERARGLRDLIDAARYEEHSARSVLASEREAAEGDAVVGEGTREKLATWRRYVDVMKMQAEVDIYDRELRSY
jgi:hypothetical protein